MSIRSVPTTRVSDTFVRQRLLGQVQSDQLDLYRLQSQLSTGRRFELPSQDPVASLRVIGLQSLLERKTQAQTNLDTTQSYLTATDSAMSSISGLLTEARAAALGVSDTLSTDEQRAAAAQTVDQLTEQLIGIANTQFRGRYLFAGSTTQTRPYEALSSGGIEYRGNDKALLSYTDVGFLSETNVPGPEVFGGVSDLVRGADLGAEIGYDTPLADLFGPGQPLDTTGIEIVNGGYKHTIDFSADETVEDLLNTLNSSGAGVRAEINAAGTGVDIRSYVSGGDFAVGENVARLHRNSN